MTGANQQGAARKAAFRAASLSKRYPRILERTLVGVEDPSIVAGIGRLGAFLAGDTPLGRPSDLDDPYWKAFYERHAGLSSHEIDFLELEYLAFHEILRAHRYFERWIDPFAVDKVMDMDLVLTSYEVLFDRIKTPGEALRTSLLGNAHDASQLKINTDGTLLNPEALHFEVPAGRIEIICDNAGHEFLSDLVLAAFLLRSGTQVVHLHVKAMPWFVSDVTLADAETVFAALEKPAHAQTDFAAVLLMGLSSGRLRLEAHPLWTQPLCFGEEHLSAALGAGADLVIIKGDLNYRRAISDVSTNVFTPWADLPYRPDRDLFSLRSVKSHCWVGMSLDRWPAGVDPADFPTDGSIFLPQTIKGQQSSS